MEAKTNSPTPPDDIDGEALLEWHRVVSELEQLGTLDTSDRAVLVLYCETWATWREAMKAVGKFGSVIKYSGGNAGASPFFKTAMESAKVMRGLLTDLGLTPSARHKMTTRKTDDQPRELEF